MLSIGLYRNVPLTLPSPEVRGFSDSDYRTLVTDLMMIGWTGVEANLGVSTTGVAAILSSTSSPSVTFPKTQ